MPNVQVFTAEHHDPWFNLATEDWIFKNFPADHHVLFLWRNNPCIVIGRFQNPWVECNLQAMEHDGVALARRQSGGGAVYHDLGNTNFTFMSPKDSYDKNRNFSLIIQALAEFGITAEQSGRNDILVGGRKISGSAFRMTGDRAFHHGTLLINTDMTKLPHYLTPDKDKLQSKGVRSVASRVANLTEFNQELTHDALCNSIIEQFFSAYSERCTPEDLTIERLSQEKKLFETYKLYADWNWRFGTSPHFDHPITSRFPWGGITLDFAVQGGVIHQVNIFSDSLSVEFIEFLQEVLPRTRYCPREIRQVLIEGTQKRSNEFRDMAVDVANLIERELE